MAKFCIFITDIMDYQRFQAGKATTQVTLKPISLTPKLAVNLNFLT